MRTSSPRPRRGLCVDIENKPGTYGPGDYTHPKVTAVGWMALERGDARGPDGIRAHGRIIRRHDPEGMRDLAEEFREVWDSYDFIVAHNGRRHDKKILNGWYMSLGLPLLSDKRLVDTYLDQPKTAGVSRSLENLSQRWGCPIKKPHLPEHVWEAAYDGQEWAEQIMLDRVRADCMINRWLYYELIDLTYL